LIFYEKDTFIPVAVWGRHLEQLRRGERKIEEKRTIRFRRRFNIVHHAHGELRQDIGQIPAIHHRAGTVVAAFLQHRRHGRLADRVIVFDEAIRRIIRKIHAKIIIEAARRRSVGDGFGKIHIPHAVTAAGGGAILGRPIPAQMPFAKRGGGIAVLSQQFRQRQPVRLDQRPAPRRQHAGFQPRAKRVAAGEKSIT